MRQRTDHPRRRTHERRLLGARGAADKRKQTQAGERNMPASAPGKHEADGRGKRSHGACDPMIAAEAYREVRWTRSCPPAAHADAARDSRQSEIISAMPVPVFAKTAGHDV